jgi:pyrrolidone-carboxylate peptidase
MRNLLLIFLALGTPLGCALKNRTNGTKPTTNLGNEGNALVSRKYASYVKMRASRSLSGCSAGGEASRRVLISGFAPFQTDGKNISGLVADALGNQTFFKSGMRISDMGTFSGAGEINDNPGEFQARATQRTIVYNALSYELCTLVLPVQWDLAAAIILYETKIFSPHLIIMSGRDGKSHGLRLEAAAINSALNAPGFDTNGDSLGDKNQPITSPILPTGPDVSPNIAMTWKPAQLAPKVSLALNKMNEIVGTPASNAYVALPQQSADPSNNYICNNTSFVVLHGLRGVSLELAGGSLKLHPEAQKNIAAGFLHYPVQSSTDNTAIWRWSHVVMTLAEAHFNP